MNTFNTIGWLALFGIVIGANVFTLPPRPLTSAPPPVNTPSPIPETSRQRRHLITINLTALNDLKVKAGDRIHKGDIISDRIQEQQTLTAKKRQLEIAIAQIRLPIPEIAALPQPSFEQEKIAIAQAKFKLNQATQAINTYPGLQFKQAWLSEALEPEKLQALSNLKEKQVAASLDLQSAIARLDTAQTHYQQQQYQHSLQITDYHTRLQHQQYELASLESQLQNVEEKLKAIVAVRSPYTGRVNRIKIVRQQDQIITAEIILEIR